MKLLLLFPSPRFGISRRLNAGFIEKLANFQDVTECRIFELAGLKQELSLTKETLPQYCKRNGIDIFICYNKVGRSPFNQIAKLSCAKVAIDVDFYKAMEGKSKVYERGKFDLVIQRGAFHQKLRPNVPMVWLPFSADENEFFPINSKRKKRIGFAGSMDSFVYNQRKIAVRKLQNARLIEVCKNCKHNRYPVFLRSVMAALNSSEIDTPYGKVFEIIASGTALLTPPFYGQDILFTSDCFMFYKPDCSDIEIKARRLLKNNDRRKEMVKKSYKIYKERHTDEKRLQELYKHLRNLLDGKPIEKPWGI